jgi:hypothetical protein
MLLLIPSCPKEQPNGLTNYEPPTILWVAAASSLDGASYSLTKHSRISNTG